MSSFYTEPHDEIQALQGAHDACFKFFFFSFYSLLHFINLNFPLLTFFVSFFITFFFFFFSFRLLEQFGDCGKAVNEAGMSRNAGKAAQDSVLPARSAIWKSMDPLATVPPLCVLTRDMLPRLPERPNSRLPLNAISMELE